LAVSYLLVFPLKDTRPGASQDAFDHAEQLFHHGRLADSQREAAAAYDRLHFSNPNLASRFQLLEAKGMLGRGMYADALSTLAAYNPDSIDADTNIGVLSVEAVALAHQGNLPTANQKLMQATLLCKAADYPACGEALRAKGILAVRDGHLEGARQFFMDTLTFAEGHQDRLLAASAALNLGWQGLQTGHFDESLDWSKTAYTTAVALGAEDAMQLASGNLGYAYFELGDDERALEHFLQAEKGARDLELPSSELNWMLTAGYVYRDTGDLNRAIESYHHAYDIAKSIDSKEDIVDALEDLAQVSVDAGKLDQAATYIGQVSSIEEANGGHLSANVQLTQGMLAAARNQNEPAETLLRAVQQNQANAVTLRLGAGGELARLFEAEGNFAAAEQMYRTTLDAFDAAQKEIKNEESQLPFVANAARIYDGYIHLLLRENRSDDALAVADQSRARTLAQSLDGSSAKPGTRTTAMKAAQVAGKTGSTLFFYWLGQKGSCLWVVTPAKASYFALPAQGEITARIDGYRKAVLDGDPLANGDEDGQALYRMLVAPAEKLIRPGAPVVILADGALSQLNFETLLAPGPSPLQKTTVSTAPQLHYWLDDATLISAPSLAMLAAARPAPPAARNLLLLGNPISTSDDFPTLPLFAFEAKKIPGHFDVHNVAAFTGTQATPAAYLASSPAHYAYIHFVSHAVSSRTDPLDSAIILSPASSAADSYKLYARDIMRHPIDAQLVTISACYGSGTRSFAGEGLVGLSWAFLRAGAHSVIGALWEVSDDSSPRLMDALYQGIEDGRAPAVALRNAKLALLHSGGKFQQPFYWAPYQIYSSR
jgi:CHAT domain-containing protein/tetratricopeptide (TPR) repeat protein